MSDLTKMLLKIIMNSKSHKNTKLLFSLLLSVSDSQYISQISYSKMAKILKCSKTTISENLKNLIENNYIIKIKNIRIPKNKCNLYLIKMRVS